MKKSRKTIKIFLIAIILLFSSGCVKFNANMEIKKDKSMDFNIIYAIDKNFLDGEKIIDDDEKKELEDAGCIVKDYSEDNMEGVSILYKVANIDSISTNKENVKFDLSAITDKNKDTKLFKIKKGIFKNTYEVKLEVNSSDALNSEEEFTNTDTDINDTDTDEDDYDYDYIDESDDIDSSMTNDELSESLEQYMKSMDLKFSVKLPYKAISNNATSTKDSDKELTWNLAELKDGQYVEFTFSLYNVSNIAITLVIILVIVGGVILFTRKNKTGKKENVVSDNVLSNNINQNIGNINPIPTPNNTVNSMSTSNYNSNNTNSALTSMYTTGDTNNIQNNTNISSLTNGNSINNNSSDDETTI